MCWEVRVGGFAGKLVGFEVGIVRVDCNSAEEVVKVILLSVELKV